MKSKNKLSLTLTLTAFILIVLPNFAVAQNVKNTGTSVRNSAGALLNNKSVEGGQTEATTQKNLTGSCDSTCDTMNNSAPASTMNSSASTYETRVAACASGFTGTQTQTRTFLNGVWTIWNTTDTSQCVCSPTYMQRTDACPADYTGYKISQQNWTCQSASSGTLGPWSVVQDSCQPLVTTCEAKGYSGVWIDNATISPSTWPAGGTTTYVIDAKKWGTGWHRTAVYKITAQSASVRCDTPTSIRYDYTQWNLSYY